MTPPPTPALLGAVERHLRALAGTVMEIAVDAERIARVIAFVCAETGDDTGHFAEIHALTFAAESAYCVWWVGDQATTEQRIRFAEYMGADMSALLGLESARKVG